jgi:hypothetical protein
MGAIISNPNFIVDNGEPVRALRDEILIHCEHGQLEAIRDSNLFKYVGEVMLDCLFADFE